VAFHTLGEAVSVNRFFDVGNDQAFSTVETAHNIVVEALTDARAHVFGLPVRSGTLRQEDSKAILQLQAADIAARFAARIYEGHPDNRRRGAYALKQHVDAVLFNDGWI
jgi:hypothetical protein